MHSCNELTIDCNHYKADQFVFGIEPKFTEI